MPGFDPSTAQPVGGFDPSTATQAFDPSTATPSITQRAPGATGLGMIGQTFQDLMDPNHLQHDPNAAEQAIMGVTYSKPVQSLQANYQSAVTNGLFMEPVRQVMESLGVGRQAGESDANLHARYNAAILSARQQAQQQAANSTIGAYDGNPVHMAERLGQQAGNVGANIVANPQYFLMPGASQGSSVLGNIANAGIVNAGIGGASDMAAQLMDKAEGVKKDFDVQQNLQSTLMSGLFGAGLHSTVEVAPYVKSLFGNRGLDTTPQADPRSFQSQIAPMTGDHATMNAADHAQYQQLLQTGSVDDIKEFFKGRQGPQPSWTDVNTWVEHRDNPPAATNGVSGPDPNRQPDFNYEQSYNDHAEQQYRETNRQAVEDHVNNQTAGWNNAPPVEVVHGPSDIADPGIKDQALKSDGNGNALGFLGGDGTVRMYSGRISTPEMANSVLYHEGLGHFGLAEQFGNKLDSVLQSMLDRNVNQFSKDTDAWQERNPGAYDGDRIRAAEEVLAERSEGGQVPKSWGDAVKSTIMQFGRKIGLKLAYSDAEVRNILSMAHDAVVKGTDVRSNGFQGTNSHIEALQNIGAHGEIDGNKFMRNALGEEQTDPEHLDDIDRLKQDPRFWSDPEFRKNVIEMARTRFDPESAKPAEEPVYRSEADVRAGKFITRSQMEAKQQASDPDYKAQDLEGIYHALDEGYTPTTVSWNETRTRAMRMGFTPDQIKNLRDTNPGELSTRLFRMQAAANMAQQTIEGLNSKLDTPAWSEGDQAKYIQALADRAYLVPRIKGDRAEYARALQISKAAASYSNSSMDAIRDALAAHESGLANLTDPDNFLKFARQVKQMMQNGNQTGAQTMMGSVNKPYWWQYLTTFHMNMMLSALSTHVKAPIDMATGITRNVIEKTIAMPIGQARMALEQLTGKTVKPGVEPAELANHVYGLMKAVSDAEVYKATLSAAANGQSSYVIDGKRTPTNFTNQFGALSNPRIPIISKPTDLIGAQDTFFRSVEMNAQLLTVATREARAQLGPKASTTDVMTLGHTLATTATPTMLKEAFGETNRTLLLNDNPLNEIINKARVVRPGMTPGQQLMSFVAGNLAPFIRVESNNLINRVIQRSPLGLVDPTGYTQSQLKAGGAKADIAISKMLYGTALLGLYWGAAAAVKDKLTGDGPDNVDKYKEAIASGWRPDAVHEDGKYNTGGQLGMSVNPFDTHNKTAQLVASARQAYEAGMSSQGWGSAFKMAMGSVFHNLADMSWVSDIQPAIDATMARGSEGQSAVSRFASAEAGTWLPNGMNQAAKITDPVERDTTAPNSISGAIGNTLASEVPGLRQTLPIKYSVYGDPLANGGSLTGVHTIIPGLSGNGTTETHDPAERELDRLNSLIPSALVTPVQHTIAKDPGDSSQGKINLLPDQFEEYQRLAGKSIVYYTQQEMDSGQWSKMSDQDRVTEVRGIETDSKKAAADAIRERYYSK